MLYWFVIIVIAAFWIAYETTDPNGRWFDYFH